jgi:leader peptidase (prepilin peptidase)/N-methyltransferase
MEGPAHIVGSLLGLAFVAGAVVGSFLNVVIYRLPRGESVVFPGSHCPACREGIRAWDKVPILSYLWLRGRCRGCRERIPLRYPLVEGATAILFSALLWRGGPTGDLWWELGFGASLLALLVIDARAHLLPNAITYPLLLFSMLAAGWRGGWGDPIHLGVELTLLFPTGDPQVAPSGVSAGLAGLLLALAVPGLLVLDRVDLLLFGKYFEWEEEASLSEESAEESGETGGNGFWLGGVIGVGLLAGILWTGGVLLWGGADPLAWHGAQRGLMAALGGALVASVPLWWIRALYFYLRGTEGMGLGDIKLMASLGAFLGWQGAWGVLLLGSLAGTIYGLFLARHREQGLRTPLPFGSFLCAGALLVLFLS